MHHGFTCALLRSLYWLCGDAHCYGGLPFARMPDLASLQDKILLLHTSKGAASQRPYEGKEVEAGKREKGVVGSDSNLPYDNLIVIC